MTTNSEAYMATHWFQNRAEVSGDMEIGSCVKYPCLVCFIISGFKRRTRRDSRYRMRERRGNQGNAIIILLVNGQVSTIRDDVP